MNAPLTIDDAATGRYWAALEAGDRSAALGVARELLDRGRSRDELLVDLVCPAQLEVGRRLGASVPAQHLAQFVQDVGPDVVALSCSVSTSLPRARQMIEAARQAGVPVVAGGRGFGEDGAWARLLGADGWAPSAAAAVTLLDDTDWPSCTRAAPRTRRPTTRTARSPGGGRGCSTRR